jgi:hypothetical protein
MIRDDSTVHEVGSGKAPNPNPREDDDDSSSIANLERIVPLKPQVVRNPKRQVFPRRTAAIPKDQRIPMDKPEGADARVTSEAAEEPGKDDSAAAPRLEMHEV